MGEFVFQFCAAPARWIHVLLNTNSNAQYSAVRERSKFQGATTICPTERFSPILSVWLVSIFHQRQLKVSRYVSPTFANYVSADKICFVKNNPSDSFQFGNLSNKRDCSTNLNIWFFVCLNKRNNLMKGHLKQK